jgi:hypothetical protein
MLPGMADDIEPDDLDRRIERARRKMDAGRADLLSAIREALERKRTPTRIGRYAHWSAVYITQIRDGERPGR